jgi:PAS domain S-box-containing protein
VLNAIPDIIGLQDLDHHIIQYNEAGYRFLGMKPSEVHGQKCHKLIGHPTPCRVCATSEVYQTQQVAKKEKFVEELDKWLDVRAYPVFDEKGQMVQVIEHLRDISSEKKAELALREAHERLFTVLNSIDAHIYVADMESYEILFMNQKMIDDFNSDYVGTKCYESFRQQSKPCDHCTNPSLVDENQQSTGVYTWQCMNPLTQRWYLNYDRAINWVDGRMVRIQIATDITETKTNEQERQLMEQQLHQAQKFEAIGTLAGGIAHDFNNLMMGIQGRISLMSVELGSAHSQQKNIEAIESCVLSAINLTNQLLGLARSGKYEIKALDLNQLIVSSVTMFGRTRKEIQIHAKPQSAPLVVEADQQQIEQVLLNLLVNAWQAMPDGGDIFVETKARDLNGDLCGLYKIRTGSYAVVEVTDTGTGMDQATQQRIFDPFFTTKEKGRGTGLGLASAYGIIKNHGGIITVQSEPGHGATFNIYLPLSQRQIETQMETKDNIVQGSETILLVDDEKIIIDVGTAMLETLGYRVIAVQSGDAAVEVLRNNAEKIDLVILDMIMPEMGGEQTFDEIRAMLPTLPVILSSGYSIDGQAAQIMRKGCNGFMQKPFNIPKLSQKIREVLDGPQGS